jgi:hypothetical protein
MSGTEISHDLDGFVWARADGELCGPYNSEEEAVNDLQEWAVIENTPGYLPDTEPALFDEYADAVAYANELADELEEQGYETDRSWASRDNSYAISATTEDKMHDLGRWIEVARTDSF